MFIVGIKKHSTLGTVASAYIIRKNNEEYYNVIQSIVLQDIEQTPEQLTDEQKEIVKLINEYSESNLLKAFGRNKKISAADFLSKIDKKLFSERLRPYVERRLVKIINILKKTSIKIFNKPDRFLKIYTDDQIFIQNKPAEAVFNFYRTKEEIQYFLSVYHNKTEINLMGKKEIIISTSPCIIVLDNYLFFFKDIDAKKLLPFYTKNHISINKRIEKKYFETFVLNSIKKFRVNAKGFQVNNIKVDKKVVFSLEQNFKEEYIFIPKFHYNDISYFHSSKNISSVTMQIIDNDYIFNKFSRDLEWEKNQLNFIKSLGLISKEENNFAIVVNNDIKKNQRIKSVNWLTDNVDSLKDKGFELIQNLRTKKYSTKKASIDFNVEQKIDWFDLHIVVRFGDIEIPFATLKNNIIDGDRELKLPNNEIAIIPEEWFSKYKNIASFGFEDGSIYKIKKVHFFAIEDVDFKRVNTSKINKLIDFFNENKFKIPITPYSMRANLRDYQKRGFAWLNALRLNNFGGCLADDMGLGKTIQTLAIIVSTMENYSKKDESKAIKNQLSLFDAKNSISNSEITNLIVLPKSLIHNWKKEIRKFTPNLKIAIYSGNRRELLRKRITKYDIVLTSYGVVRNDIDFLQNINFFYIVLDESQYIKNPNSKIYKAVIQLQSVYKLALTGTPIENSIRDIWSQMNFLNKDILGSEYVFREEYINPIEKLNDVKKQEQLKMLISPFILRRTKSEVLKDLPPLTEQTFFCEMTEKQDALYEIENSKIRNKIFELQENNEIKKSSIFILQALNKLRQIANHPNMLDGIGDLTSGKFDEIIKKINILMESNQKILIFSNYVKHLTLFSQYFDNKKFKYSILTGSSQKREQIIDNFQNNADNKLFLISIKAGGVGLNLTSASYVFILDPWWNPAVENQAISRAHRMGQKEKVMVYRFISKNTVEEKIRNLQKRKQMLADKLINSNNLFSKLSEKNIIDLFEM